MKHNFRIIFLTIITFVLASASLSQASSSKGRFGLSVGSGFPFLGLGGIDYFINHKWSLSLGVNSLDLSSGTSSVNLSMPELIMQWMPLTSLVILL
jgi:hypothetical protein